MNLATYNQLMDLYTKDPDIFDPRKANCYKCQHKGSITGDTHIKCNVVDPVSQMLLALKADRMELTAELENIGKVPVVMSDPIGRKSGFFMWPLTFDPVWLRGCFLFMPNDKEE